MQHRSMNRFRFLNLRWHPRVLPGTSSQGMLKLLKAPEIKARSPACQSPSFFQTALCLVRHGGWLQPQERSQRFCAAAATCVRQFYEPLCLTHQHLFSLQPQRDTTLRSNLLVTLLSKSRATF
ncbi:uncharacterized protein LOC143657854 [Tamandua tetradactyla]|uniref:uncharacterized protein LOC143657854 n=1 Tax=Tamandua tetradactyla TaxID=48850 RepID=UPI0040540F09